jgi:antitoxin MazE
MQMKLTAQLWGNSLGFRIPAPVARDTNLAPGSEVDLQVETGRIVLTPLRQKKRFELKSLLAKVNSSNSPSGDIWGAPVGKEAW